MTEREAIRDRNERLAAGSRIAEIERITQSFDSPRGREEEQVFSALAMLLVDAILDGDERALDNAVAILQRAYGRRHAMSSQPEFAIEERGRMLGLIDMAQWGLERVLPLQLMTEFEPDSRAHQMLRLLSENAARTNRDIANEVGVDEAQVSRVGGRLVTAGVARKRRVGRTNFWEITPRGVQMLEVLNAGGISRPKREHRQFQV